MRLPDDDGRSGEDDVLKNGEVVTRGLLEALDAVVWDGLETASPEEPVKNVQRALRRLASRGAQAVEGDCDPLYSLVTLDGRETPSAAAVALPFIIALAADPDRGARVGLVELLVALHAPALTGEDWSGAWALLSDPGRSGAAGGAGAARRDRTAAGAVAGRGGPDGTAAAAARLGRGGSPARQFPARQFPARRFPARPGSMPTTRERSWSAYWTVTTRCCGSRPCTPRRNPTGRCRFVRWTD